MIARMGSFYSRRPRGPNWYVDSAAGDDANSGKAPGMALRTIAALLSKISAGDTIGLARGSHWREQFTVPADGVRVLPYGAGARPLLDASDVIPSSGWTKTAGQTNVYQCSITHDLAIGKTFIGCWEEGVRLAWKTAIADVDAMPGSYTLSDTSASPPSPVTLYVHASDGASPAGNGKIYENASRNFGLDAAGQGNRAHCKISGIQTRRNMHNDGSLILGNYATVTGCLITDGGFHSVFVQPGCHLVDVVANGAYHPSGSSFFIWNPVGNGEDITFEGCQALLPSFVSGVGGGFGGHGTGQLGTVTYRNCIARNCDLAFHTGLFQRVVLDGCSIEGDCSYGLELSATDATVSNLQVDSVRIRLITVETPNTHLVITGLTAASTNGATAAYNVGNANLDLTMSDSVLNGLSAVASTGAGSSLTFLRNQVASGPYNLFYLDPVPVAMNSDYNTVYEGAHVQWGAAGYTWATYRAATGQDSHSTP
jgi:hypothetical protein